MSTIGPLNPAAAGDDWQFYHGGGIWTWITEYAPTHRIFWGETADAYREWIGIRFALSAAIPAGATISSAPLELYVEQSNAIDNSYIYVTASADAPQVTGIAARPAMEGGSTVTRPNTAEGAGSVNWAGVLTLNAYNSIDIKSLIQYLVNTYRGLVNGAHIVVWVHGAATEASGTENATPSQEQGANPAKLTIVFEAEGSTIAQLFTGLANRLISTHRYATSLTALVLSGIVNCSRSTHRYVDSATALVLSGIVNCSRSIAGTAGSIYGLGLTGIVGRFRTAFRSIDSIIGIGLTGIVGRFRTAFRSIDSITGLGFGGIVRGILPGKVTEFLDTQEAEFLDTTTAEWLSRVEPPQMVGISFSGTCQRKLSLQRSIAAVY